MINWWNRMTLSTLIVIKSPLLFFILGHLIHLIYSYFLHQKTATTIICIFCRVIRFRTFDWLSLLSFSSSKYIVVVMKNRKRTKFSLMRNLSKLISSISVNDSSSIFFCYEFMSFQRYACCSPTYWTHNASLNKTTNKK